MTTTTHSTICVLLLLASFAMYSVSAGDMDWVKAGRRLGDDAELEFGGIPRRALDGTDGYISYGALRADSVPCSERGASYYNCQPGASANPYTRSCTAISQCRD